MTAFETSTALERSVESGAAQVIAAWIDAALLPAGSLTAGVVRRSTAAAEQPATVGRLRSEIIAAPPAKRRGLLAGAIEREAAKALGLRAGHRFEGARPLNDYGLDSLLAVQLSNALAALLDRPLPATLLFDYPTVDALTEMLLAGIDVNAAAPAPEAEQGHADALRDVSEADAEAMLLAELGALSRLQEDS